GIQIAAALAHLHTPDLEHQRPDPLVHGDLKPENVLLTDNGWAQITDLELARAYATLASLADTTYPVPPAPPAASATQRAVTLTRLAQLGQRGGVAGSPPYMAPEQWQGIDATLPATDIYALGVLLYELFVGVDAAWSYPLDPHRYLEDDALRT